MAKVKLKDYLQEKYKGLTRRVIKRALARGACKVNGKIERFATRFIDTDADKIEYEDIRSSALPRLEINPSKIIFEDDYILIYNKDAGYPALPTKKEDRANIHDELKRYLAAREGKKVFLDPAHRLDKDTSGLMIFAKSEMVLAKLFDQFRNREIEKTYEAIVDGVPKKREGIIDADLELVRKGKGWQRWGVVSKKFKKNPDDKKLPKSKDQLEKKSAQNKNRSLKTQGHQNQSEAELQQARNKNTKSAITEYQVIKSYPAGNYSHVKLNPQTGRTHQIRVHMSHIGHAILGDSFYTERFRSKKLPARHLLHAASLKFIHPITNEPIKVFANLPPDMQELI